MNDRCPVLFWIRFLISLKRLCYGTRIPFVTFLQGGNLVLGRIKGVQWAIKRQCSTKLLTLEKRLLLELEDI
ncbi:hypothetical protein ERO13_A02G108001v2 [Gossypium hirsutum]|uniref:Uncharacterized protein n=1 Tax=Gossypium darwinii TaxID=34276 RepID=A0A5D2HEK5_GOSDA|nr:hypothetical protein ERO13_A02G108001v2 [Gossypium hirsutum]TYH28330.1 hypothetical protein ES288_A02G135300v1 [Gossypium darwinii]